MTKDPASLQTQAAVIDEQSSQVWMNRSGWISIKAESQATSDREVNFPVVQKRQTSSPVEIPQVPIIERSSKILIVMDDRSHQEGSSTALKLRTVIMPVGKKEDCNMKDLQ